MLTAVLIVGGLGLLAVGADRFIEGAAQTARALGVSPLVIGLTVVGMATSMPEMLVAGVAAGNGKTELAIGNALGSNIANIGLVLGATALSRPMLIKSRALRREFIAMFVAIFAALLLMLDRVLDRMDGLLLALLLGVIVSWIVHVARRAPRTDALAAEYAIQLREPAPVSRALLRVCFGLVLLLVGADLLVRGAVVVAQALGVSDLIIGLTVVAVGTSLPELAASIASALKNEPDIAIGNVIGSNMFNMLMVLGVPAVIHPAPFGTEVLTRDFPVMCLLSALMGLMVFIRGHGWFTRPEGGALLLCFAGYQYWLFRAAGA